ncbi:hypothetical protein Gpo141_00009562 [Globisporangium polare]
MSPHQQYAATSRGSFQGSMSSSAGTAAARPRTVGRLPSRGALASPSVAHELYLQQSGVQFYVEDLAKKLQEQRPEQPAAFIASYFSGVMKGTHVCGRAFEFVSGTMQNRLAFLTQLQKTFASVDAHMQLTLDDFTELVWCQCRDFPAQMLQQATHHLKESDDGQVRATLKAFMSAFSACFLYNEFLSRAYDIYGEMQASKDSRVVSPRGSSSVRSESIANAMAADRVVARLRVIAQQNTFSIPPMLEIEAVVYKSANFKEFCARFYESPAIASSIFDLRSAFQTLGCGSGAK